jgi:hypothetical protein
MLVKTGKKGSNQFKLKDILNADETGLLYSVLPDCTLAFKVRICQGDLRSKDIII